ncbi:hypothetical protein L7F22_006799 [Adiantum nelumboides]|nr:hypothetical protein [Adiantum nelumboides]
MQQQQVAAARKVEHLEQRVRQPRLALPTVAARKGLQPQHVKAAMRKVERFQKHVNQVLRYMGEHTEFEGGQEGLKDSKNILQLGCEDGATLQLSGPADTLFQRIDHLDSILTGMEVKAPTEENSSQSTSPRPTSRRHSSVPTTPFGLERRCKPTEAVLEEVEEKGTLVERVSDLEKRVMKMQGMLSLKSNENAAYPSAPHIAGLGHRRGMSHQEVYNEPSLQEPIDVEKHEVSHSCPLGHKDHVEPFVDTSSQDTHSSTSESPHARHYQKVSGGKGADAEEQDPRASPKPSKKKRLRIRKWLSKRLHINLPGTTPQDKQFSLSHSLSVGHCWGPKIHPKNCWNARKKDRNSYTQYGHTSIDGE